MSSKINIWYQMFSNQSNKGNKKSYLIHRLVAEHFLPKYDPDKMVLRYTNNKLDNDITNLYQ